MQSAEWSDPFRNNARLPENARVYMIIPEIQSERVGHIYSPRLVHPEQAKDFQLRIDESASWTEEDVNELSEASLQYADATILADEQEPY